MDEYSPICELRQVGSVVDVPVVVQSVLTVVSTTSTSLRRTVPHTCRIS